MSKDNFRAWVYRPTILSMIPAPLGLRVATLENPHSPRNERWIAFDSVLALAIVRYDDPEDESICVEGIYLNDGVPTTTRTQYDGTQRLVEPGFVVEDEDVSVEGDPERGYLQVYREAPGDDPVLGASEATPL